MNNKYFLCILRILCFSLNACGKSDTGAGNSGLAGTTTTTADYPIYETAKELVNASDLVFSGTIKEIKYEMLDIRTEPEKDSSTGLSDSTEKLPYTIYVISINTLYKGSSDTDEISVKVLGGGNSDESFVAENSDSTNPITVSQILDLFQ